MSVELKNWKELCKEKDERIKELEGKFDLIVERLEEIAKDYVYTSNEYEQGKFFAYNNSADIVKEVGGMNG